MESGHTFNGFVNPSPKTHAIVLVLLNHTHTRGKVLPVCRILYFDCRQVGQPIRVYKKRTQDNSLVLFQLLSRKEVTVSMSCQKDPGASIRIADLQDLEEPITTVALKDPDTSSKTADIQDPEASIKTTDLQDHESSIWTADLQDCRIWTADSPVLSLEDSPDGLLSGNVFLSRYFRSSNNSVFQARVYLERR